MNGDTRERKRINVAKIYQGKGPREERQSRPLRKKRFSLENLE